jgi:hypothetical protein
MVKKYISNKVERAQKQKILEKGSWCKCTREKESIKSD